MYSPLTHYAVKLVQHLSAADSRLHPCPDAPHKLRIEAAEGELTLDLTPFAATAQPASAKPYFAQVMNSDNLLHAYRQARRSALFETDAVALREGVHPYAAEFLEGLLRRARSSLHDDEARRIARWVANLDVYAAVKAVESLLNSRADRVLLRVAEEQGWDLHFDHLTIRCGSAAQQAARRVAVLLTDYHGYVHPQVQEERMYRFPDGWDAYPLYKILDNGQVLRVFLDESDNTDPRQIIQHWNRVYGYTAHHLAIRATRRTEAGRIAVSLEEMCAVLAEAGVSTMEPTGGHTHGLLAQVFTYPEWNPGVPQAIRLELRQISAELERSIENGKLLELLSRREVPAVLAHEFFALYGLPHDSSEPLHTVPAYQYFLPAQAAHVIRTSVQARHDRAA